MVSVPVGFPPIPVSFVHEKDASHKHLIICVLICQHQHANFQNYRQLNQFSHVPAFPFLLHV